MIRRRGDSGFELPILMPSDVGPHYVPHISPLHIEIGSIPPDDTKPSKMCWDCYNTMRFFSSRRVTR